LNSSYGGGGGRYEYVCGSGANVLGNSGDFVTISNDGGNIYSYQNGVSNGSSAQIPVLNVGQSLYLGSSFSFSLCSLGVGVSINTFGWSSFGGFMSTTDMGTYQSIVNTFMTSIGRNTY
jgi:hypothetical protein